VSDLTCAVPARNRIPWDPIILVILAFSALAPILNFLTLEHDTPWTGGSAEQHQKLDPELFKVLTFGHLPAAIDWLWMTCLVDPEQGPAKVGEHPLLYYKLDLATDLDPAFHEVYMTGGNALAIIRNDGSGARDLLVKAESFVQRELSSYPASFVERYWHNHWDIEVLLAYVYLFELNDMTNSAAAFRRAAQHPGAPAYVRRLDARLAKPGGEYEVGLKLINFMLTSAADPVLREELERKRQLLFVSQYLFGLNQSFLAYLKTQPSYLNRHNLSRGEMQALWKQFLQVSRTQEQDPWGGRLELTDTGKIDTSTPHGKVFGLE